MSKLSRIVDLNLNLIASSLRGWRGSAAFKPGQQPEKMLELYDIENCPYCRLVRETLCELDLDVRILPCPRGGTRFRPQAVENGGKAMFPLLHDPNTGVLMYESRDIIDYLHRTYGHSDNGGLPHPAKVASSMLCSAVRTPSSGLNYRGKKAPAKDLELYSFEASPYSRPVRELLSALELPYILHNMAKAEWKDMGPPQFRAKLFPDAPLVGRNRKALQERAGKVQVPYLIDPNYGVEMFESAEILQYLETTYG